MALPEVKSRAVQYNKLEIEQLSADSKNVRHRSACQCSLLEITEHAKFNLCLCFQIILPTRFKLKSDMSASTRPLLVSSRDASTSGSPAVSTSSTPATSRRPVNTPSQQMSSHLKA
jgi:hypothetical protein